METIGLTRDSAEVAALVRLAGPPVVTSEKTHISGRRNPGSGVPRIRWQLAVVIRSRRCADTDISKSMLEDGPDGGKVRRSRRIV